MKEYDLFLPLTFNDGRPIPPEQLSHFRKLVLEEFGGFTHFPQENEGVWKVGGAVFRDRVVILRVLSDRTAETRRFFSELRVELMRTLEQADILIVERDVSIVGTEP